MRRRTVPPIHIPVTGATRPMLVDASCAWMQRHSWSATAEGYAASRIGRKLQYAHRLVLGNPAGQIDHRDGDRLNNVASNLRTATWTQQRHNAKPKATYGGRPVSSIYKGVIHVPKTNAGRPYRMLIKLPSGQVLSGYFADELDAARAYDALAVQHFGAFALTNKDLGLL